MTTRHLRTLLATGMLVAILHGCTSGGGGGSGGGIGGSGIITQGTITGFGSIVVNGIRFDTDGLTSVVIDEDDAGENDLALGMIVTITGSRDDASLTGEADAIVVDHSIRGPVAALGMPDSDDKTRTISILGQSVRLRRNGTVFEGTSFDDVSPGDMVRVNAFRNGAAELAATRLEHTGTVVAGSSEIEFSGTISDLIDGTSFDIGAVAVTLDSDTVVDGPALADGQFVEVEGIILPGLNSVLAREIEPESSGLPSDANDVEIAGIVEAFSSLSNFTVAGVSIDASTATFEPSTLRTQLALGARVEIEGDLVGGVLIADEVEGRGGSVSIEAFVETVSLLNNSLELAIAPGNTLLVLTDAATRFVDERDEMTNFDLSAIAPGDFLLVESNQSSPVLAIELTRIEDEDKVQVSAMLEASAHLPPAGSVTLLGVEFLTDDGVTEFESDTGGDDDDLDGDTFYARPEVLANTARIKVSDDILGPGFTGDGQAEEVEIVD